MKQFFGLIALVMACSSAFSQNKFGSESARLTFFSGGAIEDIRASNTKVTSIFDGNKGDIAFLVRIKDFQFEKKLMQVHFNEKFLESEKYPKSTFLGNVVGFNPSKAGIQQVVAIGKLSIHGVTREVKIPGTLEKKGSNVYLKSKFLVKLSDYNINIPQIVWQNIAEDVEVDLNISFTPL